MKLLKAVIGIGFSLMSQRLTRQFPLEAEGWFRANLSNAKRPGCFQSGLTLKVTGPPTKCGPKIKACDGGSG